MKILYKNINLKYCNFTAIGKGALIHVVYRIDAISLNGGFNFDELSRCHDKLINISRGFSWIINDGDGFWLATCTPSAGGQCLKQIARKNNGVLNYEDKYYIPPAQQVDSAEAATND